MYLAFFFGIEENINCLIVIFQRWYLIIVRPYSHETQYWDIAIKRYCDKKIKRHFFCQNIVVAFQNLVELARTIISIHTEKINIRGKMSLSFYCNIFCLNIVCKNIVCDMDLNLETETVLLKSTFVFWHIQKCTCACNKNT